MDNLHNIISQNIGTLLEKNNLNPAQLARAIGLKNGDDITVRLRGKNTKGKNTRWTPELLKQIANHFDVSIDYLHGITTNVQEIKEELKELRQQNKKIIDTLVTVRETIDKSLETNT